jgi:hypothetical protein
LGKISAIFTGLEIAYHAEIMLYLKSADDFLSKACHLIDMTGKINE